MGIENKSPDISTNDFNHLDITAKKSEIVLNSDIFTYKKRIENL